MKFAGKRALVTGAGDGIGRDLALKLSELGAEVFALSRTKSKLDTLQEEDPKIKIISVDISDWEATRKAVEGITPIHLLVNNAASFKIDRFLQVTSENLDDMFAVNIKGYVNIAQVVVNDLVARNMKGNVVNVSSDSGLTGFTDCFSYGLSKAAVDMFTRCAVAELAGKGIRINSVNPTLVATKMGKVWVNENPVRATELKNRIPMRRINEISDITNVIVFLLSDESDMVNGHTLPVDGGFLCCQYFVSDVVEN